MMVRDTVVMVLAAFVFFAGCIQQTEEVPTTTTSAPATTTTTVDEYPLKTPVKVASSSSTTTTMDDETRRKEAEVLEIAAKDEHVAEYIKENPTCEKKITEHSPKDLTTLAKRYQTLYGDLPPKTLYRIDYSAGGRGMIVIVDKEEGKVLKKFRLVGVNLN